jgi:hypothetical protein
VAGVWQEVFWQKGLAMADLRTGGCMCGAVRYEMNIDGHKTGNCHCRDCQKNSGAGFMPFTNVDAGQFRWINEPEGVAKASEKAVRRFCNECGTPMTWEGEGEEDRASISTGTFDDPSGIEISYEIYTRSRWPAFKPVDGARQYEDGGD